MEVKVEKFKKTCECGRPHNIDVRHISIQEGAIEQVNSFLKKEGIQEFPTLICDSNTYHAAGAKLYDMLTSKLKNIIILEAKDLDADENGIQGVVSKLDLKSSVLLAVGAGTIHDITRYIAKEYALPFISIPTAASVDGFVSTVAAMTMGGFKITYPAVSPIAVFADTNIFSQAPYRLTASGVADLLGKYTALLDWQISNIVTGEYICDQVVAIEKEAVENVVGSIKEIYMGNEKSYEVLMYGLILSGIAMQMVGNSRPASGSEHHISHLWEMHVINPKIDALHGEKVGVALGLVCDTYKKIMKIEDIKKYIHMYNGIPHEELKKEFKHLYQSIIEENTPDILEDIELYTLEKHFEQIQKLIEKLPSGDEIRKLLTTAGAKTRLDEIGLDATILEKSIKLSPFVRRRLTLMRILQLLKQL